MLSQSKRPSQLALVKESGRDRLVSFAFATIVAASATVERENNCRERVNGKWGYINETGKLAVALH